MEIVVNGNARTVAAGTTIASLLRDLSLPPMRVAVERNREIVRKAEYETAAMSPGDRIEIVTFVGGG